MIISWPIIEHDDTLALSICTGGDSPLIHRYEQLDVQKRKKINKIKEFHIVEVLHNCVELDSMWCVQTYPKKQHLFVYRVKAHGRLQNGSGCNRTR